MGAHSENYHSNIADNRNFILVSSVTPRIWSFSQSSPFGGKGGGSRLNRIFPVHLQPFVLWRSEKGRGLPSLLKC